MQKRKKTKFKPRPAKKADPKLTFSYKRFQELGRFVTDQGSILSREATGLSQKQQRWLSRAVKRARHLALMPFTQTV